MRAIEFKNVSFRYEDMPEPVLKSASFSLKYGRLALLYGDSGQGKSTVLSILSGVMPVASFICSALAVYFHIPHILVFFGSLTLLCYLALYFRKKLDALS